MLKPLLKKEFISLFKNFFVDRKTGKAKPKKNIILSFLLFLLAFVFLGGSFFSWSVILTDALLPMDLGWLFFSLLGIFALMLGTFGSVFNTYAGLYHAKDNELLLSMPIKPVYIILSRLIGVYLITLLYESIVFIPGMICYWIRADVTVLNVIFPFLLLFILSFLISALTCLLGWLVAVIASRIRNTKIITVFISLVVFGIYYFVCFRFQNILFSLIAYAENISEKIKSYVYPFYAFGLACEGDPLQFLIFTLFSCGCFLVVFLIMSRSFIKIATASSKLKKKVYVAKQYKEHSVDKALFIKEVKRFTSSSVYMLNCGLGLVIMPVIAVALIIKGGDIISSISQMSPQVSEVLPALSTGAVCILVSTNCITAPSVSLEGKNIWFVQSLPVDGYRVLLAKLKLHVALNTLPSVLITAAFGIAIKTDIVAIVISSFCVICFDVLLGMVGLILNLKMPNLNWTNETVPVKQGWPIMISMFGGWIVGAVFSVLSFVTGNIIDYRIFVLIFALVFLALSLVADRWLRTKGQAIFATL